MLRAGEKVTDDERSGLSEEELAVLDDDSETEEGKAALSQIADGDDDDDDADDADEKAAAAKAAAEKAATEKAEAERKAAEDKAAKDEEKRRAALSEEARLAEDKAKQEAASKAKAETEAKEREEADRKTREAAAAARPDEEDEPFVPTYIAPMPENYEQRVKDLDKRRDEATAAMKAGGALETMLAEHEKVERERRELEAAKTKHDISVEAASQAADQRWHWEIRRFMRDVKKHEGIDYDDSRRLNAALDAEVKTLAADKANDERDGRWFLQEAHKRVKVKLGIGKPASEGDATEKARKEAEAKAAAERKAADEKTAKDKASKERKPALEKLPKTLGGLPSAGAVDIGSDGEAEFADAEALMSKGDSMALEAYIAGKSPEWQERWARFSG